MVTIALVIIALALLPVAIATLLSIPAKVWAGLFILAYLGLTGFIALALYFVFPEAPQYMVIFLIGFVGFPIYAAIKD